MMELIDAAAAERRRHPRPGNARPDVARTQQSSDHRVYLGDAIVAELRAARLPLEPRQFEFMFAYKSGRNAALNAAADAIRARKGALDRQRISTGCTRPTSRPGASASSPRPRPRGSARSCRTSRSRWKARSARRRSSARPLPPRATELSINGALTLQDVLGAIDRLTQSTKEAQVRYALLEARIDAVTHEVGALQKQLAAVRAGMPCRSDHRAADPRDLRGDARQGARRSPPRRASRVAVILCNLDYFAAFNENFGTYLGDQVLRSIGLLFKAHMRPGDMVARFAGDAFARDPAADACGARRSPARNASARC